MIEKRPIAEAIAAERQTASGRVPMREGECSETTRHSAIAPALVGALDQRGTGRLYEFCAGNSERAPQFLAIVDAGKRREQRPSVRTRQRPGRAVRVAWPDALHDQPAFDAARDRPPIPQGGECAGSTILRSPIDRTTV
jgi:hypothetical protein